MGTDGARASDVLGGGQRLASRPGLAARALTGMLAPVLARLLDRIDGGLAAGALHARLPDGSRRTLGGRAPGFECEVTLHQWRGLLRVAAGGSVGLYQGWENGEWSSPDPVQLFALFMANATSLGDAARAKGPWRWVGRAFHWANRNTRAQAEKNIHAHYDLGNDFYTAWLDPTMTYSSGYAVGHDGIEAAQRRKWARLAERLGSPERVLEIGCGWGALAAHLADRGAAVEAISISDEQLAWARARYPKVAFRKQDYRDLECQFDAVVSVEMVEALGREYWPAFLDTLARVLRPGGRAAIQYIAIRDDLFDAYARGADFIQAYVFPGGMLLRASEFRALAEARGLVWHEQEDFGADYAETLRQWRRDFDAAAAQGRLPAQFDRRFCDLWRFYLMYCEGGFLGGGITVSQVTLVKQ